MSFRTLFLSIIISTLFFSCKEEEPVAEKGNVKFGFSTELKTDNIARYILVSVTDKDGASILSDEKIELFSMNGSYLSSEIDIEAGDYKLTKFVVLNANNEIIYLTPQEGSIKAILVSDPLPISFSISASETTTLLPEVVAVDVTDTPSDFGYLEFGFVIVDSPMLSYKKIMYTVVNGYSGYESKLTINANKSMQLWVLESLINSNKYLDTLNSVSCKSLDSLFVVNDIMNIVPGPLDSSGFMMMDASSWKLEVISFEEDTVIYQYYAPTTPDNMHKFFYKLNDIQRNYFK